MVELEDFKYGGTNITALRLVNPDSELVQQVNISARPVFTVDVYWIALTWSFCDENRIFNLIYKKQACFDFDHVSL